jgi:hypothetical protein
MMRSLSKRNDVAEFIFLRTIYTTKIISKISWNLRPFVVLQVMFTDEVTVDDRNAY